MGQFSLPRGYYVVIGRLVMDADKKVQPSCYPGRHIADGYAYDARRLFFHRTQKLWNATAMEMGMLDAPASMEAVLEELERKAGKDYLVWVAKDYTVPIEDHLLMSAASRLQRTLNASGVKIAKPLSDNALACFANLKPSAYCDEGYALSSRKVRKRKKHLGKKWKTLDDCLGASKHIASDKPPAAQHS